MGRNLCKKISIRRYCVKKNRKYEVLEVDDQECNMINFRNFHSNMALFDMLVFTAGDCG